MLTDQSGDMLVIEPTDLQLTATFNPTHVLTNTPNLAKHIANLNRFLHTDSTDFDMTTIAALQNYHGPIPEKHIPTDRFIKTNIALRQRGHEEEIPWTFGLLDSVKIEKTNDRHDYTHYEGIINTKTTDYYFRDVATGRTIHRNLHDLIDQFDQPQVFNEEAVL